MAARPENVFGQEECPPGLFIYDYVDGLAHTVSLAESAEYMFQLYQKEADDLRAEYEREWESFCDGQIAITIPDDRHIEICTLKEFVEG